MTQARDVIAEMQTTIDGWQATRDHRAIFLTCYQMMTQNMLIAIDNGEFEDGVWVNRLLHDFADYYFNALTAYDTDPQSAPVVWQHAFQSARRPRTHVLQHLILGVNAHINYDLVYVIYDMLHTEWPQLSPEEIAQRYRDHCHVNDVIYRTIDAVQADVVGEYSAAMNWVDTAFLKLDEWLLHRLICRWREGVWTSATRLMTCTEPDSPAVHRFIEQTAVQRGQAILFERGLTGLRYIG